MKESAKKLARALAFMLLVALLFIYLNMAFVIKGTMQNRGTFDEFYQLPENSVDVMYIGASSVSRFFVNPVAFHDYGLALFSFGANSSPSFFISDLIDEVELSQDPSLYVIDLRTIKASPYKITDGMIRNTLDMINLFSPNRPAMALKAEKYAKDKGPLHEYLFPFFKYHSRLMEGDMTIDDFKLRAPLNRYEGFVVSRATLTQAAQDEGAFTDEVGDLPQGSSEVLEDLLDHCDALGKDVVFVASPYSVTHEEAVAFNKAAEMVQERGYTFINFNNSEMCEEVGIDWRTDYYNPRHTNYLGAEKYTRYLSAYLREAYELPDRRGDAAYQGWESSYEDYKKRVKSGIKYVSTDEE